MKQKVLIEMEKKYSYTNNPDSLVGNDVLLLFLWATNCARALANVGPL